MNTRFVREVTAAVSVVLIIACASRPLTSTSTTLDAATTSDLAKLRAATTPYKNLESAVAAGYPREQKDCLVHEHHGAMGYHHVNRSYLDTKRDVTRPQILLYERMPDNSYRLNAVEFIIPYRLWPKDSVPPTIFGRQMHHEDNLKIWYLHVWAWLDNSEGLFANFNPAVSCPDSTRKVYTPFPVDG